MYTRHITAPSDGTLSDGSNLWERYSTVSRLWDDADGVSVFRVQCDDPGFSRLMADDAAGLVTAFPSLTAPASALRPQAAAYLAKHGITPGQTDTVLNALRKIRDAVGSPALIDLPH